MTMSKNRRTSSTHLGRGISVMALIFDLVFWTLLYSTICPKNSIYAWENLHLEIFRWRSYLFSCAKQLSKLALHSLNNFPCTTISSKYDYVFGTSRRIWSRFSSRRFNAKNTVDSCGMYRDVSKLFEFLLTDHPRGRANMPCISQVDRSSVNRFFE